MEGVDGMIAKPLVEDAPVDELIVVGLAVIEVVLDAVVV